MKHQKFLTPILLVLISCGYACQLNSDRTITQRITDQITEHNAVDFSKIEGIEADEILILEPYTQIDVVQRKLKIDLSRIKNNSIYQSDYFNLIVFLKSRKAVTISELNRSNGDFNTIGQIIPILKARFKKEKNTMKLMF